MKWCIQEKEANPTFNICEFSVSMGCRVYEYANVVGGRGDKNGDKCIIFTGIKRYQ